MTKNVLRFSMLLCATVLLVAGCSKKATKIEETAQKPAEKPKTEQQPVIAKQETVAMPSDSFKIEDPDAKTKEILQPIYFIYDKFDLSTESVAKLGKIAPFLQSKSTLRVLIECNADERGSNEYNMGLGESRARTVKNYLTTYGIPENRIEMTSYGKERPAVANCGEDDACHAKNRRVEWKVLGK